MGVCWAGMSYGPGQVVTCSLSSLTRIVSVTVTVLLATCSRSMDVMLCVLVTTCMPVNLVTKRPHVASLALIKVQVLLTSLLGCNHSGVYYEAISARIVNIWTSLPNSVVDTSTVNAFIAWLDKFWLHQAVKYDFTADLTGTGNRSEEVTK